MRLDPRFNAQRYPVRCCCDPTRIIGWVPWVCGLRWRSFVLLTDRGPMLRGELPGPRSAPLRTETITLELDVVRLLAPLRTFDDHATHRKYETSYAIKSNERPLSFWQRIPGFVPERESHVVTYEAADRRRRS